MSQSHTSMVYRCHVIPLQIFTLNISLQLISQVAVNIINNAYVDDNDLLISLAGCNIGGTIVFYTNSHSLIIDWHFNFLRITPGLNHH